MSRFQQQGAAEYDSRIGTLVPGYDALHQTSAALLKARLPDTAKVLVVGAGTGTEVLALAVQNPHWQVCALEPSADMLAIARQKCTAQGLVNVAFVEGYVDTLPAVPAFDAVLCLLVMHFVATVADKQAMLVQMASRLVCGAPLLLCDLMQTDQTERDAMVHYAVVQGLPSAYAPALHTRLQQEFFAISEAQLAQLAASADLCSPQAYFRALGFVAYCLDKTVAPANEGGD